MYEPQLDPLVYSRPIASAARLGDDAPDRHRFLEKCAVLTGDPTVLATANGRVMALTALRLLPRLTPSVTVWLPGAPDALFDELQREAARVAFGGQITIGVDVEPPSGTSLDTVDAVLSVGPVPQQIASCATRDGIGDTASTSSQSWTTIASNGWCVWVARGSLPLPVVTTQTNPVGAVAAASLGVAEVFKVFMALKAERGAPADGTPFSLFTYTAGDAGPGPALPDQLQIDALVVGFGAIGNGIIATLAELPLVGRIVIVDRQKFGPENLGTCVLLGPAGVGKEKPAAAATALAHLSPRLVVDTLFGDAEKVLADVRPVPAVVLNGLDNPDARREAQRLWADLTIDGAIGDFMCQVSRHPGDPAVDTACLRCLFSPEVGPHAELVAAMATGLRPERVLEGDDVVREEDVLVAPAHHQETLRTKVGQSIKSVTCAVTREALAQAISEATQRSGFEPSVPFVATCSSAMVVGEWVKSVMQLSSPLDPRFQFDVLHGPAGGIDFPESRHPDCECVQRRGVIEHVRAVRRAAPAE